jgi:hypothetical protein
MELNELVLEGDKAYPIEAVVKVYSPLTKEELKRISRFNSREIFFKYIQKTTEEALENAPKVLEDIKRQKYHVVVS